MKTEEALDLAYENPFTCITTESLYEYGEQYFYYDIQGNLKDNNANIINEEKIYEILPEAENEDFEDWIEADIEVSEKDMYDDSNYDYDSYDD